MSERPLPDDPAHWPEDANELLGVSYGVSPRDLRRAYHRLIRIYKPEQSPEQFRRIREAYEYLLRIADLFGSHAETLAPPPHEEPQLLPAPKELSSEEDVTEWVPESPRLEEEAMEGDGISSRPRSPVEELDELWELAVAGQPSPAYQRLMQLHQQYTGRVDIYLRLYWLLTLSPELDSRRVPVDWLMQGLLATGLDGSLRELYREEVADDPAEALSERYERLLDSPVQAGLLADLAEWRFQAAVRLKRWDVLAEDLPRLRPRFGFGEEQLWLRLVFSLADGVAWATDTEGERLLAICREEIASYEYTASNMSHYFDRFDLLLEAAAGWRKLSRQGGVFQTVWWVMNAPLDESVLFKYLRRRRRIPATFLRLLGVSWFRPLAEVREALMSVLEAMAGSPQQWLNHLDKMHERAPATLALFGELLDRFEEIRETMPDQPREQELTNGLVRSFLPRLKAAKYNSMRKRLLAFCLDEAVSPEEMAEVASGFTGSWLVFGELWARELNGDWPLRYVCRACRLFWA